MEKSMIVSTRQENNPKKKVVIIGGGFGGINVAIALKKAPVDLMLIDKTNHHLFQPLLYQVATAALSGNNIATPFREILHKQKNVTIKMDEAISIDTQNKKIQLLDGEILSYDTLVVATGAINSYFGHNEWKAYAHGLKSLTDAELLREHILFSFERAESSEDPQEAEKHLRFVIVGGGPTGVEMAGAIAEVAHSSILKNFKKLNVNSAEILLIEGTDSILPSYPEKLRTIAKQDLEKMGVTVMTNSLVTNITKEGFYIKDKFYSTANIIWTAGNEATQILKTLGVLLDRHGRVIVEKDLSVAGHPDLFVIGDAAAFADPDYGTLPGLAPVAIQQGKHVAKIISENIPKEQRKPFKYFDKGNLATIGKAKAVAHFKNLNFSGVFAWLIWSFVHILYLINFRNRIIVMTEWIFLYFTGRRNASNIIQSIDEIEGPKSGASMKQNLTTENTEITEKIAY